MRLLLFQFIVFLNLGLSSCTSGLIYKSEKPLPESGWSYRDSISFNFEISDTIKPHIFWLDIGHSAEYTYENLYLKVTTSFPNGTDISDIMPIQFSDGKGQWIGDCNSERCDLKILMQEKFFFQQPGVYKLTFEQYSREDTLKGISDLQVSILEAS